MLLGSQTMTKSFLTQIPNRSTRRCRPDVDTCFFKANCDLLKVKAAVISENINTMFINNTAIHKLWDPFKTDLISAIHEHIPSKMKTNTSPTPWITRKVSRRKPVSTRKPKP
ncbi:hypothetical protein DPMN_165532 [Dreissena polymorpha]|uniref:Uncharacterized protein n=1 Tax=Dreissena polymorpha TaxID=45954 RepID=A0A9D4EXS7_DREPO|nr:hypothetical protein DPMN_165532 [Dreissena polymorpha]